MEILLYFDPIGITQRQWTAVWDECLGMLQCFPVPLASRYEEEICGKTRNVWKSQLIEGEGDKRRLCIQGDMASLAFGGKFCLYRNIKRYKSSKKKRDILWIDEDSIDEHGYEHRIWENGTSGAPYSLAVLAIGILLENRFPCNCYMYGFGYSDEHINNMCAWLSGALKTKMQLPVCNDPAHLLERLLPLYPSISMVVRRFCKLVNTSRTKSFEFLISQGLGNALQDELARQMSRYSSVSQWGVTDLLYPYLEATNDVEPVAQLVKRVHADNGSKEFSLEELLKNLTSKGVCINPLESSITKEWNETGDSLVSGIERLNRLLLRMGGMPDRINFYISPDKLLEIFGSIEPENGVKFKKIIERETRKCLNRYKKLEDASEKIVEKASDIDDAELDKSEVMARWVTRRDLPCEDYILRETESQVKVFPNSVEYSLKVAGKLGKMAKEDVEKNGKPFISGPREEILKIFSFFSGNYGFALRQNTWEAIDNEPYEDILTMLTIYAALPEQNKTFWEWRKYILETPELWGNMRDEFLKEKEK